MMKIAQSIYSLTLCLWMRRSSQCPIIASSRNDTVSLLPSSPAKHLFGNLLGCAKSETSDDQFGVELFKRQQWQWIDNSLAFY